MLAQRSDQLETRPRWPAWLLGWFVVITLLIVQRPVFAPNLWWHLSRGREVASGTLFPAQSLLSLDTTTEASWASGLPVYLLWSLGGIHALAATPLCATLALLIFIRRQPVATQRPLAAVIAWPCLLWTIRDGLQPVPQLFDLVGLILLWTLFEVPLPPRKRQLLTLISMTAWSSLGTQPIWGLLLIATRVTFPQPVPATRLRKATAATTSGPPQRIWLKIMGVAILGGILTPRGLLGWRDAMLLFAPSAFGTLNPPEPPGTISVASLGLLWSLWMVQSVRSAPTVPSSTPFILKLLSRATPLLAAWLNPAQLPLCGMWIVLQFLHDSAIGIGEQKSPEILPLRLAVPLLALLSFGAALMDAAGRVTSPYHRLGWGIAQELDVRLLDARLFSIPEETAIAWAPDGRSAGIVSWLDGNVQLADHPQRAFLGGRERQHAALIRDLQGAHRARYRLDDGSWGGWVSQLSQWNVAVLLIPVEHHALSRSLENTPWKPIDLDSPTIPFASGEDLRFGSLILEGLLQQDFVDSGPWQPPIEIYSGQGWRYDWVELLGGGPDPSPAIRQSRIFRSLGIPMASLRALQPVRQVTTHPDLTHELRQCSLDMAYREWLTCGATSEFRARVFRSLMPSETDLPEFLPATQFDADETGAWMPCVTQYLNGQLQEAVESLPLESVQQHYAAAMIWIELGDTDHALEELEHVLADEANAPLRIAALDWQQRIKPLEQP